MNENEKYKKNRKLDKGIENRNARAAVGGSRRPPVGARLTARDLTALRWLVDQRAATTTQVSELLGQLGDPEISARRGLQIIQRWEEFGLCERRGVWHGEPALVFPTTQSARLVGEQRWRRPAIGLLRHTVAVSEVRLRVCRPGNSRGWMTEQELRRFLPEGSHIPDGAILETEPAGSMTAVEVELTHHGRERTRNAVVETLSLHSGSGPMFHHVLYLCGPKTIGPLNLLRDELPTPLRDRLVVLPCPA